MVGDKRGPVRFGERSAPDASLFCYTYMSELMPAAYARLRPGSCGVTEGLGLTYEACIPTASLLPAALSASCRCVQASCSGQKPHVPPSTANRIDNSGTWGAGDHD